MSEQEKDYYFLPISPGATTYQNSTNRWLVIIGCDQAQFEADADSLIILNPDQSISYDGFELEAFGAAAVEIMVGLPRRMLLAPMWVVKGIHNVQILTISCRTLDLALRIL